MVEFYTTPHCICHFFWRDGYIVQFLQLWNVPDDSLSVQLCVSLCARVLLQTQVSEAREVSQPADLTDVWYPVLPYVELLQVLAGLDVCQGGDIVDTQGQNLHIFQL